MKNKILTVILIAIMLSILVACSGQGQQSEISNSTTSSERPTQGLGDSETGSTPSDSTTSSSSSSSESSSESQSQSSSSQSSSQSQTAGTSTISWWYDDEIYSGFPAYTGGGTVGEIYKDGPINALGLHTVEIEGATFGDFEDYFEMLIDSGLENPLEGVLDREQLIELIYQGAAFLKKGDYIIMGTFADEKIGIVIMENELFNSEDFF